MKRVVSISLGTSRRNKREDLEILGQRFLLERIGTDGDLAKFASLFAELDGTVDALGVGGADLDVVIGRRRYGFAQIKRLVSGAKVTPVVDGSGLKHTLERETIRSLDRDGVVRFHGRRVLLVSAVDRFGMAQALVDAGAHTVFGDLLFGVGLPIKIRTAEGLRRLGGLILPLVTRLPFKWFYPTGEKQEQRSPRFPRVFEWAEVICGDWHYIRRYAPGKMPGKIVITQTLRKEDLDLLREWQVAKAITTTPAIRGETFATNVMEGVIVALLERHPRDLTEHDYLDVLARLEWKPNVIDFTHLQGQ